MEHHQEILKTAEQVLQWAHHASKYTRPFKMYASHYQKGTLTGMCGMASIVLGSMLEQKGHKVSYRIHRAHVHLVVDDQILDITAQQFRTLFPQQDKNLILFGPFKKIREFVKSSMRAAGVDFNEEFEQLKDYYSSKKTYMRSLTEYWRPHTLLKTCDTAREAAQELYLLYPRDQTWSSLSGFHRSVKRCEQFIQNLP